jgi:hypothetical protein
MPSWTRTRRLSLALLVSAQGWAWTRARHGLRTGGAAALLLRLLTALLTLSSDPIPDSSTRFVPAPTCRPRR